MTDNTAPGIDLAELLALLPRPIAWADFKAEILPAFSPPLVSRQYHRRVIGFLAEMEALDVAPAGQGPRAIRTTADLGLTLIARWIESRPAGESPYTLRNRLMVLHRIVRLAVESRCLAVDPFAIHPIRKLVRVGKPRNKRALSRDEVRRLCAVLRADVAGKEGWALFRARRLLAAVATAAMTGLRRTELLTLHVEDLDLAGRIIRLVPRGERGMGFKSSGSAKPVGMPLALVPILQEYLAHRMDAPPGFPLPESCPWLIPTCRRRGPWLHGGPLTSPLARLKAAGRRAGIPDLTWHALRRTLATAMEAHGAGRSMIQRQLRHSDVETTSVHYLRADEAAIAEAMKGLSYE